MKRFLIACVLFFCIIPFASAVDTWFPTGSVWTTCAYPAEAYKIGDGSLVTMWNSNGACSPATITGTPPAYYSKLRIYQGVIGGGGDSWTINGACVAGADSAWVNLSVSGTSAVTINAYTDAGCTVPDAYRLIYEVQYLNGTPPPLAVDFTATPTSGTAPLTLSFTDTSTNLLGTETWNWSVSPAPGVSITTPAARNTSMTFGAVGNYTIVHGGANAYYSDIENKTDYIYVYNSTSTTTLHVTAINALNAYPIHGAQVNLKDVENSSWSNTTTTDGTGTITALNSHTINAYVSASGFSDNEKLGIPVTNTYDSVLLFPTNITSVIAGNVTLFVSVFDSADHSKPIVGAGVTVITPTTAQGGFTNTGGSAQFVVPNKTTVLIDAEAAGQGYMGATQSTYTGTGSGGSASVTTTIYLSKKTVTPTAVITTLPGGGYPTTQPTILHGCEDPMSAACQASQNEYSMGWLSQNGLMLIKFFVVCFIVFMLKGMGR